MKISQAIIIAAGMGSRLGKLTADRPKCLVEIAGKSILVRQADVYRRARIDNIAVVKGYREELIQMPAFDYFINQQYRTTNTLSSLMCAEALFREGFVASYGDILFNQAVMEQLLADSSDIRIAVDLDWEKVYAGRTQHPVGEAEKVIISPAGYVKHIGKELPPGATTSGEFAGIFACSQLGARIFSEYYSKARRQYAGEPFFSSPSIEKAYLSDFLHYLAESGVEVRPVTIRGGWREMDTQQDVEAVEQFFRNNGDL